MLVPVIGLVPVGGYADHYTCLPQIGLYIAGTWAVVDLTASWRRQRIVIGTAALLVIGVLSWSARIQTSYWRDTKALLNHSPGVRYYEDKEQKRMPALVKGAPGKMRIENVADASEEISYCERSQS